MACSGHGMAMESGRMVCPWHGLIRVSPASGRSPSRSRSRDRGRSPRARSPVRVRSLSLSLFPSPSPSPSLSRSSRIPLSLFYVSLSHLFLALLFSLHTFCLPSHSLSCTVALPPCPFIPSTSLPSISLPSLPVVSLLQSPFTSIYRYLSPSLNRSATAALPTAAAAAAAAAATVIATATVTAASASGARRDGVAARAPTAHIPLPRLPLLPHPPPLPSPPPPAFHFFPLLPLILACRIRCFPLTLAAFPPPTFPSFSRRRWGMRCFPFLGKRTLGHGCACVAFPSL
jgi:hypothetical protein